MQHGKLARETHVFGLMLLGAAFLCGCSNEEPEASSAVQTAPIESTPELEEAAKVIGDALEQQKRASAARYPCSLLDAALAEEILGTPMDAGDYTFVNRSENEHQWKSQTCAWSALNGDLSVNLWVSGPQNFDTAVVQCIGLQPSENVEPDLASRSRWEFRASWNWGVLRVCEPSRALLEVEIMYGADEAHVRGAAREIAALILAESGSPGNALTNDLE